MEGPLEFHQYFEIMKVYGNYLNMSRATVPYIVSLIIENLNCYMNGRGTVLLPLCP